MDFLDDEENEALLLLFAQRNIKNKLNFVWMASKFSYYFITILHLTHF